MPSKTRKPATVPDLADPAAAPRRKGKAGPAPNGEADTAVGGPATGPAQPLHPKLRAEFRLGAKALTAAQARTLLGWEEEPTGADWGEDFLFRNLSAVKVRFARNARNRPFKEGHAKALCYDILNRNWADSRNKGDGPDTTEEPTLNGESVIIGRHGNVLSAQHRLAALVMAEAEWASQPHWKEKWPDGPPSIECLIVYGVDESPRTTRTLDNVRARDLADVLYSDEKVFGAMSPRERETMTKLIDNCVKALWERTGARDDAWSPYRTHSESLDFVARHKRLLRCVKHIHTENTRQKDEDGALGPWRIGQFVPAGRAAALMFLMASSGTEGDVYWSLSVEERNERLLKWGHWDRAVQYWEDLAAGRLPQVPQALAILGGEEGQYELKVDEKIAVVCKSWPYYRDEESFKAEDIVPETRPRSGGGRELAEVTDVGGIDQGRDAERRREARAAGAPSSPTEDGDDDEEGDPEDGNGEEDQTDYEGGPDQDGKEDHAEEAPTNPAPTPRRGRKPARSPGPVSMSVAGCSVAVPVALAGEEGDPPPPTPDEIEQGMAEALANRERKKQQLLEDRQRRRQAAKARTHSSASLATTADAEEE
jgi:hypothetical protein